MKPIFRTNIKDTLENISSEDLSYLLDLFTKELVNRKVGIKLPDKVIVVGIGNDSNEAFLAAHEHALKSEQVMGCRTVGKTVAHYEETLEDAKARGVTILIDDINLEPPTLPLVLTRPRMLDPMLDPIIELKHSMPNYERKKGKGRDNRTKYHD